MEQKHCVPNFLFPKTAYIVLFTYKENGDKKDIHLALELWSYSFNKGPQTGCPFSEPSPNFFPENLYLLCAIYCNTPTPDATPVPIFLLLQKICF